MSEKGISNQDQGRKVTLSASFMAVGTLISRILGFVREAVIASCFDRFATDAFYVAFRLPNLFRRLLGEGSLSISFIPVFIDLIHHDPQKPSTRARELASAIFSLLLVVLMVLTVCGILYMEPIVGWLTDGKGYASVPGKFELTVHLAKIMFAFVFLISLFAFFMAILNGLGRFALAGLAPGLLNLSLIVGAFLPTTWFEIPVDALAWAALAGGALQAGVLIPQVIRLGYFPKFSLKWQDSAVHRVLLSMGPSLVGMGVIQITALINTKFASRLEQGAHSWLYWADRILELPLSLFAVSLGSALLPTLSQYWVEKNREGMAAVASHSLRKIYFVAVPAAFGIFFLAQPIIEVLFMRGKFTLVDAEKTASILHIYAFILLVGSGVRVIAPVFYAMKNTWLPAGVSLFCLAVHIFVANIWVDLYGLRGLVFTSLLSGALNFTLLLICYRWIVGSLQAGKLIVNLMKYTLASGVMALGLQVYEPLLQFLGINPWSRALSLMATIILGSGLYFIASYLFKSEELEGFLKTLCKKLKR